MPDSQHQQPQSSAYERVAATHHQLGQLVSDSAADSSKLQQPSHGSPQGQLPLVRKELQAPSERAVQQVPCSIANPASTPAGDPCGQQPMTFSQDCDWVQAAWTTYLQGATAAQPAALPTAQPIAAEPASAAGQATDQAAGRPSTVVAAAAQTATQPHVEPSADGVALSGSPLPAQPPEATSAPSSSGVCLPRPLDDATRGQEARQPAGSSRPDMTLMSPNWARWRSQSDKMREARKEQRLTVQQLEKLKGEQKRQRLLRIVRGLQHELSLANERDARAEGLACNIQLIFMNDQEMSPKSRQAIFRVATAYSDTLDLPCTDSSVARAAWHGGEGNESAASHPRPRPCASPAAKRACELALEFLATAIAKARRVGAQYLLATGVMTSEELSQTTPKQKHFARVAVAMNLTAQQKQMGLVGRESYFMELGRVLWHRKQLLQQLQVAALQLEDEADGDIELGLRQPSPVAMRVVNLLDHLRQGMEHQRYLMRSFGFHFTFEVMSPYQYAILLGRSPPYYPDPRAVVEAIASEQGALQSMSCSNSISTFHSLGHRQAPP
ncbi:hypothetical protein WJX74_003879 [Apatococcus lobatus]|uniref:Uncharacterized protein n=1 Tax=Apatococcus lobatus TaxID=904363 RepID=A0AAW1QIS7_9CHLO